MGLGLILSCGGGGGGNTPAAPAAPTLTVSPATGSATAGGSGVALTASLTGTTGTISWAISPAVGSLSATTGTSVTYTPPASMNSATAVTVTASVGTLSAACILTVSPPPTPALTVSPATGSATAGGSGVALTATLTSASGTISWAISPAVGSLSATTGPGVTYTPPSSVSGTTVVTVTASAGTLSGTCVITVSPDPSAPSLTLSPSTAAVTAGGSALTLTATLRNASGPLTWDYSPFVGTVGPGSVQGTLVYTPPPMLAIRTDVTVTVRGAGLTATAVVTVNPPGGPAAAWTPEGTIFTDVTAGYPGKAIADIAVIHLADGRWRILFTAGEAMRSALSSDGLAFTMEPGIRLHPSAPMTVGLMKTFRLADGRWRAYFQSGGDMCSAVSADEGLTWTDDPGIRITAASMGLQTLTGGAVVPTTNGWRMYFSGAPGNAGTTSAVKTYSAFSTDLLAWTVDPGVRIGPTAATLTESAEHPCAIVNADGSVTLYYFRNLTGTWSGLFMATSTDGLTFGAETALTGIWGNDPMVVNAGGFLRMYYNNGNDVMGNLYAARHSLP